MSNAATTRYLSTTQIASRIRKELKKSHGWTSRQVSVRSEHGMSIRVTIRSAEVSKSAVEAIAMPYQSVRYCESSGEILSGGNIFVTVKYSSEASGPLTDEIEALLTGEYQRFGRVFVDYDAARCEWQAWQLDESGDSGMLALRAFDKRSLARNMAEAHLSGELLGLDLAPAEPAVEMAPATLPSSGMKRRDYQAELWDTYNSLERLTAAPEDNAQVAFLEHIGAL